MSNENNFSTRLKELRKSMNLTQKQFAEIVGTNQVTLSAYENNSTNPSLEVVKNIATSCNVSIDWLCGLSEKKNLNIIPSTYADLMKLSAYLLTAKHTGETEYILDLDAKEHSSCITFHDDRIMNKYFMELSKILSSVRDGTIPQNVFELWIDSKTKLEENHLIDGAPF